MRIQYSYSIFFLIILLISIEMAFGIRNISFHRKIYTKFPFCGTSASSAKPDQTPQNAASDHVLHCLLTEVPFKI